MSIINTPVNVAQEFLQDVMPVNNSVPTEEFAKALHRWRTIIFHNEQNPNYTGDITHHTLVFDDNSLLNYELNSKNDTTTFLC